MKTLTLDETWKRCLEMWRWVVKEWKSRPLASVDGLKREWIREHHPEDLWISCACYFCQYNTERDAEACEHCPGALVSSRFRCNFPSYDYCNKPAAFLRKLEQLNKKRLATKGKTTKKGNKP